MSVASPIPLAKRAVDSKIGVRSSEYPKREKSADYHLFEVAPPVYVGRHNIVHAANGLD